MTAWQYLAGAGLVAALCPLHGHVAVAADGDGRGARADVCVPGGQPGRPVFRPPSVRPGVPGADRPTVHHPGRPPEPPAAASPADPPAAAPPAAAPAADPPAADPPERARPPERPEPPSPAGPAAEAGAVGTEPPEPAPAAGPLSGPDPADAPAPPRLRAAAAPVSAFHVRPYRSAVLERRGPGGMSTVMLMVVVTTPAVLAAAALRPRSKSRG
ncbi:hypothetical protein [Streptomyces sp. NPDC006463]|uniref:hypothetical protein n=1 Tax=Streptomyces sp. NPDC006463 TaxID=3364746 RepID=UPI0036A5A619